jgi:predicted membrane chloride channel (bestrophin family)
MLDFLQEWPTMLILLAIVALSVVPTAVGLLIVRRLRPVAELRREHDVVGFTFSVVSVIYGVLLGFVLSTIWGQYSNTDEVAQLEGVSLRNLYRNSFMLPATNQVAVRTALTAYAHAVVEDEWQTLRHRRYSQLAQDALQRMWNRYYVVAPATEAQKLWLAESIKTLNEIAKLRSVRILAAEQSVNWLMWVLLLAGGAITCGFMYAFGVERFRAHLLMTAAVAALILLILFIIYELDNPFWGDPHIEPSAFLRFIKAYPTPE